MPYLGLIVGTILIIAAVRYRVNVGVAAAGRADCSCNQRRRP